MFELPPNPGESAASCQAGYVDNNWQKNGHKGGYLASDDDFLAMMHHGKWLLGVLINDKTIEEIILCLLLAVAWHFPQFCVYLVIAA